MDAADNNSSLPSTPSEIPTTRRSSRADNPNSPANVARRRSLESIRRLTGKGGEVDALDMYDYHRVSAQMNATECRVEAKKCGWKLLSMFVALVISTILVGVFNCFVCGTYMLFFVGGGSSLSPKWLAEKGSLCGHGAD
jgi:hypothetical protein